MDYYTFRKYDSSRGQVSNPRGSVSLRRTLTFRGQHIMLSQLLAKDLNVKAGSHLAFTLDEKNPDRVFVRPADYADDEKDIQYTLSNMGGGKQQLRCTNASVVRHIHSIMGATKSCTCYVSPAATKINGKDHYQILVSCPININ